MSVFDEDPPDDGGEDPPFDGFGFVFGPSPEELRRVDSSIREPLGGLVEEQTLEDLDRYFKRVWVKHHG